MAQIPIGYCQCGCGEKTNISKRNHTANGHVKGEPFKYVFGHQRRIEIHNYYPTTKVPGHPKGNERSRVRNHILVAENVLGKPLPQGAVVHHVDGNIDNNSPSNLVLCQNNSYHRTLHARAIALEACGHASWRKCRYCHEYDDPNNMYIYPNGRTALHRKCAAIFQQELRNKRKCQE